MSGCGDMVGDGFPLFLTKTTYTALKRQTSHIKQAAGNGKISTLERLNVVLVHVNCRDFNIFSSHGLLPSDLVAQSVERRRSNPKVVGSIPTLVRVFLCPCVGPFPSVGLTLTWFIWDRNRALHITLYSVNSV